MRDTGFAKKPVQEAIDILSEVKGMGVPNILVALSGGKDSVAVLDLCYTVFGKGNVFAFHCYWIKGLEIEESVLRILRRRYSIETIELPHPGLKGFYQNSMGRTFSSENSLRMQDAKYDWKLVEAIAKKRSGARWIANGSRMQDSLHRRGMLNRCQGIWERSYTTDKPILKVYPVYRWRHTDIFSYLKMRKLPIPDMAQNSAHKSSGTDFKDPDFLLYVKKNFPEDYEKIKKFMPRAEDVIYRDMVRAKHDIRRHGKLEGLE